MTRTFAFTGTYMYLIPNFRVYTYCKKKKRKKFEREQLIGLSDTSFLFKTVTEMCKVSTIDDVFSMLNLVDKYYKTGMIVTHKEYGRGVIYNVNNHRVYVRFFYSKYNSYKSFEKVEVFTNGKLISRGANISRKLIENARLAFQNGIVVSDNSHF